MPVVSNKSELIKVVPWHIEAELTVKWGMFVS